MSNEIQHVAFNHPPTGGTWALAQDGFVTTTYGTLAWYDPAANVRTVLYLLPSIGNSNVQVTGDYAAGFDVEFINALADTDVSQMTGDGSGLVRSVPTVTVARVTAGVSPVQEVQVINLTADGGSWTVNGSSALVWDDSLATVQGAINTALGGGGGSGVTVTGTPGSSYVVTWNDVGPQSLLTVDGSALTRSGLCSASTSTLTGGDGATQEVQRLTVTGGPVAGTWKPAGTTAVSYAASPPEIEAAVEADLGVGVSVATAGGGVNWDVTWDDVGDQPDLTPDGSGLLAQGSASVSRTTAGVTGATEVQTLTLADAPDGGTWVPTTGGQAVAWDAAGGGGGGSFADGTVGEGLAVAFGNGVIGSVTGPTGTPPVYTVTWSDQAPHSLLTPDGSALTRADVTITVTTTQEGGGSTADGDGSAAGTSTCTGVGAALAAAVGTSAGSASCTATGATLAAAAGSSAGSCTATGAGSALAGAVGLAAGLSTVAAAGVATANAVGTAAGTCTVSGTGAAFVGGNARAWRSRRRGTAWAAARRGTTWSSR